MLKKVRFGTLDELYAAIGYGGQSAQKSAERIKEEMKRLGRLQAEKAAAEKAAAEASSQSLIPSSSAQAEAKNTVPRHSSSGIIVEGLDGCMVKFAKCCTPVPGDPIVGFITKGYGVSVHRQDCPNADPARRKPEEEARWVHVAWADNVSSNFDTALELSAKDRDGLTLDVAMALSAAKVRVRSLSARSMPDGYAVVSIELEVRDQTQLTSVINKLGQIQSVYQVRRASGR